MSARKRGLGRGLNELGLNELLRSINQPAQQTVGTEGQDPSAPSVPPIGTDLRRMAISAIQPGKYQPRRAMDEEALEELAQSIASQGIIQPLVVREVSEGSYELLAGERRWRAAQRAGLDTVPVVIKPVDDEAAMAIGLIENIQRKDLNAVEQADAMQRLQHDFGLTHQQISEVVGKSRVTVSNLLRLLQLDKAVRRMLENGDLDMGHARALLALPKSTQVQAAKTIADRGLSVREAEKLVHQIKQPPGPAATPLNRNHAMPATVRAVGQRFAEQLPWRSEVTHSAKGTGRVVLHYKNAAELEAITRVLLEEAAETE